MPTPEKNLMETIANQLTKTEYQRQIDAIRLIPQALRSAIALGMDKDAAIQGANRAVAVITGVNVMELFSVGNAQEIKTIETYLSNVDLCKIFKTNGTGVRNRMVDMGIMDASGITEAGRAFWSKKGWSENIVELLKRSPLK